MTFCSNDKSLNFQILGEGQNVADKDIPVDIHEQKLISELISRRLVPSDWKDTALSLNKKLQLALTALPKSMTPIESGKCFPFQ